MSQIPYSGFVSGPRKGLLSPIPSDKPPFQTLHPSLIVVMYLGWARFLFAVLDERATKLPNSLFGVTASNRVFFLLARSKV